MSARLDDRLFEWMELIRAEYCEMPGLRLTKSQVQRLWGLDPLSCELLLDALETSKFLTRTRTNAYVKADAVC
jgi:hypothetical protein